MSIFNNPDFFPTPEEVAHIMCSKVDIHNKIVLEPSMGKGDLVDVIRQYSPSKIIGCELSEDLLSISSKKVDSVLGSDFLSVRKEDVSHIQCIIANPPFSNGDKHALKMWEIAPEGCQVVVILNEETVSNRYNRGRSQLGTIIDTYGYWETLGNVFTTAERKTNVCVAVVVLNKPIVNEENYDQFFDMDEEQEEAQGNGVMKHDEIREIVNRYVGALKTFDSVISAQSQMNSLIKPIITSQHNISFVAVDSKKNNIDFESFRLELQKSAWQTAFNKLNADKYMTSSLKGFLNKFVEQQKNVPFTCSNIYKMIQMVVGTHGDRMNKVIIEVFDWLTEHHHENRYNNEGWKTNSEYVVNKKFIAPYCGIEMGYTGHPQISYSERGNRLNDLMKAMCWITGTKYEDTQKIEEFFGYHGEDVDFEIIKPDDERKEGYSYLEDKNKWEDRDGTKHETHLVYEFIEDPDYRYKLSTGYKKAVVRYKEFGTWYDWGFFRVRVYKKGTMHAEFKDEQTWIKFNQTASKAKGFQLASKFTGDFRAKKQGVEVYA